MVPASKEVSRFTSPAKVAVRPLNMKMKTEKNATIPKGIPESTAIGLGLITAWRNSRMRASVQPSSEGEAKMNTPPISIVKLAAICSMAKKPRLSWGTPLPRVFLK